MTRSLSNLIKANYIYFNQDDKKVIDSDSNTEKFRPVNFGKETSGEGTHEFIAGIKAINLEEIKETEEEIEQKSQEIIAKAYETAEQIVEEAKSNAQAAKLSVYDAAKQQGYGDGYNQAVRDVDELKLELENKVIECKENYEKQIAEIEPFFAGILTEYIKKLTGIMAQDHREIILHLIHQAVMGVPGSSFYTIKVSKEDYGFVKKQSKELEGYLKNGIEIEIIEDGHLGKNQCLIETDARTVDCSLNVQMENLITDIKLLARI